MTIIIYSGIIILLFEACFLKLEIHNTFICIPDNGFELSVLQSLADPVSISVLTFGITIIIIIMIILNITLDFSFSLVSSKSNLVQQF